MLRMELSQACKPNELNKLGEQQLITWVTTPIKQVSKIHNLKHQKQIKLMNLCNCDRKKKNYTRNFFKKKGKKGNVLRNIYPFEVEILIVGCLGLLGTINILLLEPISMPSTITMLPQFHRSFMTIFPTMVFI